MEAFTSMLFLISDGSLLLERHLFLMWEVSTRISSRDEERRKKCGIMQLRTAASYTAPRTSSDREARAILNKPLGEKLSLVIPERHSRLVLSNLIHELQSLAGVPLESTPTGNTENSPPPIKLRRESASISEGYLDSASGPMITCTDTSEESGGFISPKDISRDMPEVSESGSDVEEYFNVLTGDW